MIYRIDKKASFYSLDTNYFMRVIALEAIIYDFSKNGGNNAKQRALCGYFDCGLAVGPGFPPKTESRFLIISGKQRNSETALEAGRFSCWRGRGDRATV